MSEVLRGQDLDAAMEVIVAEVRKALSKHGGRVFSGKHEAYGIMAEEVAEALVALRKDSDDEHDGFYAELADIACACIMAIASDIHRTDPVRTIQNLAS